LPAVQKTDGQGDTLILTYPQGYPRFSKSARHRLTDEETSHLLSLTVLSLSTFQVNHCRFVVVRDQELRKQLQTFFSDQTPIPPASSFIILCADLRPRQKTPRGSGENGAEKTPAAKTADRNALRGEGHQRERDEAMCACGIAAQTLLLTAKAMGFDGWPVDGFDPDGVGALINLPQDYVVAMLLVAGKKIKQAWPKFSHLQYQDIVVIDQF
jgi:nitroreductase